MNKKGVLFFIFRAAILVIVVAFCCRCAVAAPIDGAHARKFIGRWLKAAPKPLGCKLNRIVRKIDTFYDDSGQPVYYVVYLEPDGFVITPADDLVEPVICFAPAGIFDYRDNNPLGAMISRDIPGRLKAARGVDKKKHSRPAGDTLTKQEITIYQLSQKASRKWTLFQDDGGITPLGYGTVSDIRVAPLLRTKWGQTNVCSNACYNYYTPPNAEGSTSNYPAGCVSTAMAQFMYYHRYPVSVVGTPCFTIYVNGNPETRCLRGGDGAGGAYDWDAMALDPDCTTTLAQRQAIAALTHDAGVAVEMQYTSASSGAYMSDADSVLVSTFAFSDSIRGYNNNDNIPTDALIEMVNPNLDWGNPVILGVTGTQGGHALVTDGYGYNGSTLYHHLNLGWDGTSDAWYNLPNIDSSPYAFNVVDVALYNIYVTGTGEIISGRITDSGTGQPISDVNVTAVRTGGGSFQDTTDANGIYAFAHVPSDSIYTLTVTKTDYTFSGPSSVSTGRSRDGRATTGNVWAVDFQGLSELPRPPVAFDLNATAHPADSSPILLTASDDGRPNPPGAIEYIIVSLPAYGYLSDPASGTIDTFPYTLLNYGNTVYYTPNPCFNGSDGFQYKANDGGQPPNAGDSNIASVVINVQSEVVIMLPGDFEGDCDVDYDDLSEFIFAWLAVPDDLNWNANCDIAEPPDEKIDLLDFAVMSQNWLTIY